MTTVERLGEIVANERENEIMPLLQSLDDKERRALGKQLNQFKFYWEFTQKQIQPTLSLSSLLGSTSTHSTYEPNGTDRQKKILTLAHFFCDDMKGFMKDWARL